jgi:uridylate kinase
MARKPKYRRVLLKISGETLCTPDGFGVENPALRQVIHEIRPLVERGVQIGLVAGGGNYVRGRDLAGQEHIHRTTADYMGMLATIINGIALRDALQGEGIAAAVLCPIHDRRFCEPFSRLRAVELLESGHVVILAGGTGSPFFTTDTCAALRAAELDAQVLFKATKVDGVFDSDPAHNPRARKYNRLTYEKVLADKLGVMDLTAISLCMERRMPIVVFQLTRKQNLLRAAYGENVGTMITS